MPITNGVDLFDIFSKFVFSEYKVDTEYEVFNFFDICSFIEFLYNLTNKKIKNNLRIIRN